MPATAGLARTVGAQETFDLFARFGARDFRDIGHKAIYVANSWRTLQTVGWRHSEPVLRSLGYALLQHHGSNPAQSDHEADRPGRLNEKLIHEIRDDWQRGELKKEATSEMLDVLRGGTWEARKSQSRGITQQRFIAPVHLGRTFPTRFGNAHAAPRNHFPPCQHHYKCAPLRPSTHFE